MAPVTFHGGPLHGATVDTSGPWPTAEEQARYILDGRSFVYQTAAYSAPDTVHVRPAAAPPVDAPTAVAHEAEHARAVAAHPAGKGRRRR